MKYRIWLTIRGGVVRPSYDGYIDVWTSEPIEDSNDAARAAVRELNRSSFRADNLLMSSVSIERWQQERG